MREELNKISSQLNIEYVGIADKGPYKELEERIKDVRKRGIYTSFEEQDIDKRIDPSLTMTNVESIIVCLFPYFVGHKEEANLSKYTFGKDYHLIIKEKLNIIGEYLKEKEDKFEYMSFVDTGPMSDRYLAYKAGLGFFGINSHIITEKYGSYVFIGYMMTNYPFEADKPLDRTCIQCFNCVRKCPGQIILGDFNINPLKCRSYLSQKKKELDEDEKAILKKKNLVFGCDVCQDVCPHNRNVQETILEDFKKDLMPKLDYEEIEGMSNRGFKRVYGDRAFSWRGRKTIIRNFDILENRIITDEIEK